MAHQLSALRQAMLKLREDRRLAPESTDGYTDAGLLIRAMCTDEEARLVASFARDLAWMFPAVPDKDENHPKQAGDFPRYAYADGLSSASMMRCTRDTWHGLKPGNSLRRRGDKARKTK